MGTDGDRGPLGTRDGDRNHQGWGQMGDRDCQGWGPSGTGDPQSLGTLKDGDRDHQGLDVTRDKDSTNHWGQRPDTTRDGHHKPLGTDATRDGGQMPPGTGDTPFSPAPSPVPWGGGGSAQGGHPGCSGVPVGHSHPPRVTLDCP